MRAFPSFNPISSFSCSLSSATSVCASSYSAWCSSSRFLVFCSNSDVRFLCTEEVSPARQPSSETRSCSSVQLFRGHHVRRTPRLQARGLFRCASVGGSQRTHLWQCGCDLCLASSSTLGPCRHQGKSACVPAFNCFEVTAFGEPPDCRLLGFSGALALAAASARIDGSVVAAPAPTESPISMELTNTVVRRYAGYCVLTWA